MSEPAQLIHLCENFCPGQRWLAHELAVYGQKLLQS